MYCDMLFIWIYNLLHCSQTELTKEYFIVGLCHLIRSNENARISFIIANSDITYRFRFDLANLDNFHIYESVWIHFGYSFL